MWAEFTKFAGRRRFATILADPPWQFSNRTGKIAPEYRKNHRYKTVSLLDLAAMPISKIGTKTAHLYLWVPNALLPDGLQLMKSWGFTYKTNIIWYKVNKNGLPDRRGVGFYFRNTTEIILFGVRGPRPRTRRAGRTLPNILITPRRDHSRKPQQLYDIIEKCSRPKYLELFARTPRNGWYQWGSEFEGAPRLSASKRPHKQRQPRE